MVRRQRKQSRDRETSELVRQAENDSNLEKLPQDFH
jgi:hypothetical protein